MSLHVPYFGWDAPVWLFDQSRFTVQLVVGCSPVKIHDRKKFPGSRTPPGFPFFWGEEGILVYILGGIGCRTGVGLKGDNSMRSLPGPISWGPPKGSGGCEGPRWFENMVRVYLVVWVAKQHKHRLLTCNDLGLMIIRIIIDTDWWYTSDDFRDWIESFMSYQLDVYREQSWICRWTWRGWLEGNVNCTWQCSLYNYCFHLLSKLQVLAARRDAEEVPRVAAQGGAGSALSMTF